MPISVIRVRGTGEALNASTTMLGHLLARLDPAKHVAGLDLPYPASVGPANQTGNILGPSEDQSVAQGLPMLDVAVRTAPGKVGVCAYSLGGVLVSRYLEGVRLGAYDAGNLVWVAMVANPCRAAGDSIDLDPVGSGINGAHGPWPDIPVWEAANPDDAITSCPPDSPLRDLAAGISPLTFASLSWTEDLYDRLRYDRWPVSWGWWRNPIGAIRRYGAAAAGVWGYLYGGQHTSAYLAGGFLDRLAATINARG